MEPTEITAPVTTAGYGLHIDPAGRLPWAWAVERLRAARNYWVATTRPDGAPHVLPVWGLWLDDAFWFSTDPASRKGRNLAERPRAVVHLESGDEVVVLDGTVERVTGREDLVRFATAYPSKYDVAPDPDAPGQGVYRLVHRVVLGWREADFPASATRWVFGAGPGSAGT